MGGKRYRDSGGLTVSLFFVILVMSLTDAMKPTVLLERFPYRFVETEDRGWIEKYESKTKRYTHMYECGCQLQMTTAMEDIDYVRWLDPAGVPCYRHMRGDSVFPPSRL